MINFDDFKKLELITAKVKEVNDHPNADRLYLLKIDIGEEEKQIVAGIRSTYTKEELVGKNIVVVNNLEPAVIRGEESNGMLLAASNEEDVIVLTTDKEIPPGSRVG